MMVIFVMLLTGIVSKEACGLWQTMQEGVSMPTRRNIYDLDPNEPDIAALKTGIATMMARLRNDPTSKIYRARIHRTDVMPTQPLWNQCQHGSFFFLPWRSAPAPSQPGYRCHASWQPTAGRRPGKANAWLWG